MPFGSSRSVGRTSGLASGAATIVEAIGLYYASDVI